jgi:hypothetical protein
MLIQNMWFFVVSQDHGPDSSTEWQRVKDLDPAQYPSKLHFVYDKNNVFKKYTCPLVFRPDGTRDQVFVDNPWGMGLHPTNVRYDPAVYAVTGPEVTRDTTCIAMTRSLGTFLSRLVFSIRFCFCDFHVFLGCHR